MKYFTVNKTQIVVEEMTPVKKVIYKYNYYNYNNFVEYYFYF